MVRRKSGKGDRTLVYLVLGFIAVVAVGVSFTTFGGTEVRGDVFEGSIINTDFDGEATGVVLADTDCKQTGGPMILTCTAIISEESGMEIHFKYTHDMGEEPCLSSGEEVRINAQTDGTATVTRG